MATFSSGTRRWVTKCPNTNTRAETNSGKSFTDIIGGMISQARMDTGAGPFRINSQKTSCPLNCFIAKSKDGVCKCIGHLLTTSRQCRMRRRFLVDFSVPIFMMYLIKSCYSALSAFSCRPPITDYACS